MAGVHSVDLEFDTTGPKVRFGLWKAKQMLKNFAARLDAVRQKLDLTHEATRSARRGIPELESTGPCAVEQRITNSYVLLANDELQTASEELAAIGAQLSAMGTDVIESAYATVESDLEGTLSTIETRLLTDLPSPMRRWVDAETSINAFDEENDTANEPTNKSYFLWLVYAMVVAFGESLINSLLLKEEMGFLPGAGFALVIGLGLAAIGTFAGIGVAQLRRKQTGRKVLGGVMLVLAVAAGAFFILAMGHYRSALHAGDANAVVAAKASFLATPAAPLFDFSILPYIVLNVVGMYIIAAKAMPMFGYLDLRRLRARHDEAESCVNRIVNDANQQCDDAQHDARGLVEKIAARSLSNASDSEQLVAKCRTIVEGCDRHLRSCSDACIEDHQRFREIVAKVHPAGGAHLRFKSKPAALALKSPVIDARYAEVVRALVARSVTMRDALPAAQARIDDSANAAKSRIAGHIIEIEEAERTGRGNVANMFRFKRAGGK